MPRREPDGDTGVEVTIDRLRSLDRRLSDLEAWVAGKLPHTHAMDGVSSRAARVYLGSAQSISTGTNTKVELDTADFDPHGLFDSANNQIALDKAGVWVLAAQILYAGNSTGNERLVRFDVGAAFSGANRRNPTGSVTCYVGHSTIVDAASGDTVELIAKQDSGGALDVVNGAPQTWLSVAYLGS